MRIASIAGVLALAACSESTGPRPRVATGVVVLNGVDPRGVTVVPIAGGAGSRLDFGAAYDGAVLTLLGDTVVSTSSSFGGDLLYVASVATGVVLRFQLPAASNPAGAAPVPAGTPGSDQGRYVVALRNSGSIAQVRLEQSGGAVTPSTRVITDAGRCPSDVVFHGGAAWSVDANLRCDSDYGVVGPARLIRVPLTGGARDTIVLGGAVRQALRAFVVGDFAYVLSAGDYAATPGAITKVNLATRQVVQILSLPAGVFGVSMRVGEDGALYATGAGVPPAAFAPRVYTIDPGPMTPLGPVVAGQQFRTLVKGDGSQAQCYAATADAAGRVYCVENGQTLSTVHVFEQNGTLVRSIASGSLGFDIALR